MPEGQDQEMSRDQEETPTDPGRRVGIWLSYVGGGLILLSAFAVSLDVITRRLFGATYLESFELTRYAFAIAVALGFSSAAMARSHIRIDVLYTMFPRALRLILDIVSILALIWLAAVLAWYAWDLALESFDRGSRSATGLRLPLAGPQMLWASGLTLFLFSCVWLLLRALVGLLRGQPREVERAVGIPGSYAVQSLEESQARADHRGERR